MTSKNELISYSEIINNENKFKNLIIKEQIAEIESLDCCTETDKELIDPNIIPPSKIGSSRSIASQIQDWIKTLSEEEKLTKLMFMYSDNTYKEIEDFIINKYEDKNDYDSLKKWKLLFNNYKYRENFKRILKKKIFEYKIKLSFKGNARFFSQNVYSIAIYTFRQKDVEKSCHKAVNKANREFKEKVYEELKSIRIILAEIELSFLKEAQYNKTKDVINSIDNTNESINRLNNQISKYIEENKTVQSKLLVRTVKQEINKIVPAIPENIVKIEKENKYMELQESNY